MRTLTSSDLEADGFDPLTQGAGTEKPWYQGWDLTEAERDVFRLRSRRSKERKDQALRGEGVA